MSTLLAVLLVVAGLVTIHVVASWAGKCKSCGSWKNWLETRIATDDHQPSVYFENTIAECSDCHNRVFVSTVTRHKEISQYERYNRSH